MKVDDCSYPCGGKGPRMARRIARGIVIGLAFALVFGLLVQLLWNWLMPGVFGLKEIHYTQAIGLVVLAHILFGPRGMRHGRHGHGHHWGWGACSSEDVANGDIKDWRRYHEWWDAEGREAFKKYIDGSTK